MMEKTQDLRYPYGNSGAMIEPNMKNIQSFLNGGEKLCEFEQVDGDISRSYGLRENPKKTFRAHFQQDMVCKQCGKVFQSMKALCGHMAFHSERKLIMDTQFEERKPRNKAKGKRYNRSYTSPNASSSVSEIEGKDQEEIALCLMMLSRDFASSRGGVNTIEDSSDKISVNEMRNTKEISKCGFDGEGVLHMDKTGDKKLNSSSNVDAEMVQQDNSDSEYFLDDVSMSETAKVVKIQGYRTELRKLSIPEFGTDHGRIAIKTLKDESKRKSRESLNYDDQLVVESYKRIKYGSAYAEVLNTQHKRTKYECLNCKKIFKSFQALGGHRPCHKRSSVDDAAVEETILESEECSDTKKGQSEEVRTNKAVKKVRSEKQKGHACPYCQRVFKSGQALGGHKRSHFLGSNNAVIANQSSQTKLAVHDLFDLNLSAPQEEDSNTLW